MRPTSLQLQQFNKPPKTTYQVLLGKFTTPVQTTKDGIPLSCYCRAIEEQVDDLLLDMFRTEFHLKFLWGSRGATVSAADRHSKFEQVLTVMSDKCEPPEPPAPTQPSQAYSPAIGTSV
ncbi:hypothetical protein J6590_064315 [Homalodisca vitripennis]|nr:hypothetical protein J6590_064315 [Homalodisca vitripennis]